MHTEFCFSFVLNHIQKHKCDAVFKSRVKRQIFDMKMKRKLIQENRNSQKMVLIAKALHSLFLRRNKI